MSFSHSHCGSVCVCRNATGSTWTHISERCRGKAGTRPRKCPPGSFAVVCKYTMSKCSWRPSANLVWHHARIIQRTGVDSGDMVISGDFKFGRRTPDQWNRHSYTEASCSLTKRWHTAWLRAQILWSNFANLAREMSLSSSSSFRVESLYSWITEFSRI